HPSLEGVVHLPVALLLGVLLAPGHRAEADDTDTQVAVGNFADFHEVGKRSSAVPDDKLVLTSLPPLLGPDTPHMVVDLADGGPVPDTVFAGFRVGRVGIMFRDDGV